ncbi:MAG: TRAM domain-containing protein [Methanotrichaceae archaeon]|nr:TRAM domain-containing protein [Methanotrichaceae archaeon]
MARDQRDHYYKKAKQEGYRARSAYKLLQMNSKFHLIGKGDSVVDLGAAPGGWLQVAKELSGGKVVGVDLEEIASLEGVITIRADITAPGTAELILEALGGPCDVVISDAAPNLSGVWDVDHSRSIDLARQSLALAKSLLRPRGNFLVKVFQGDTFIEFLNEVRREFSRVQSHSPKASRKESAEMYIVGRKLLSGPVRMGDIVDVEISYMGSAGDGVAMVDGFAVIVKGGAIGDRLRVRIEAVKPNFAFGEVIARI